MESVHIGDHVEWDSRQGHSTGVVEKELTHATKIKGYTARATEESPQYLVKSDTTGAVAAHKPEALHMMSDSKTTKKEEEKESTGKEHESKSKKDKSKKDTSKEKGNKKGKNKEEKVEEKEVKENKKSKSKSKGKGNKKEEEEDVENNKKRKEHDEEQEEENEKAKEKETKEAKKHAPKKQKQSSEEEVHHYDLRSHPTKHELDDKESESKNKEPQKKRSKVEHKEDDNKEKKGHAQHHTKSSEHTASHPDDEEQVIKDFHSLVNMSANEIHKWLDSKDSKDVGWKGVTGHEEGTESVGHASGKHIIEILHKKNKDFSDEDLQHMRKVRSYIKRHLAQKPAKDIEHTRWRYSLMNWGHDPTKD